MEKIDTLKLIKEALNFLETNDNLGPSDPCGIIFDLKNNSFEIISRNSIEYPERMMDRFQLRKIIDTSEKL